MELVNSKEMFKDALKNHYAIGAFNFVNMEIAKSILNTASECNSPVIMQCSTGAIKYAGAKTLVAIARSLASDLNVPVCLNLDHGKTFEDCKLAVDSGFTNVMIDASSLPYEENIALTKKVVEYAHAHNVTVESELGVLAGVEEDVVASHNIYTSPEQAEDFVKKTGIDSLAIAIGTSHGTHKFKGEAKLQFDILSEIEKRLPNFPLVLHGASSIPQNLIELAKKYGAELEGANGIPEVMLNQACKHNICKINVDSDLKLAFTAGIRKYLTENPSEVDIRKYNGEGMKLVQETIKNKMENVFDSANRA